MADGFLLDSDICIYPSKNLSPALTARVRRQEEGTLFLFTVSFAQVGLGVRDRPEEADALRRLETEVPILPFDDAAARRYAGSVFRRGRCDRLIAAHALATGLTLVTSDEADRVDITGLTVENWTR